MDEFLRKEVRNDYQMLGLLEMDLGHVRLPLRDFADPDYTARLQDFRRFGIKVTAFHFGLPGEAEINRVAENCDVIETFEVIVSWKDRHDFLAQAAGWRSRLSCELALTRVESSAEKKTAGVFAHYVSYGFNEDAWLEVASFLAEPGAASVVDRFVFTLGAKAALAQTVARLDAAAVEAGTRLSYNVRMASENPAAFAGSEDWAAARVAEAVLLAESDRSRVLMCDTMVTTERGYFPRQGLLDRRMNPTTAGKVCRTLGALLSGRKVSLDEMSDDASGRRFEFTVDGESLALVLPTEAAVAMAGGAKLPEGHCIFELTEGTAMRTTPEGVPMLACSKAFARKAGLDHHGQTFLAATKEILPTC